MCTAMKKVPPVFFSNPTYLCNVAVIPHDMKNHTGTLKGEDVINSGLKEEI